MKKLNLNRLNFVGGKTLTRAQLKKIMGGDENTTGPETSDFETTGTGPDVCADSCGGALGNCNPHEVCRFSECTDKNGIKSLVKACFHA